jgi:hypothetical protein
MGTNCCTIEVASTQIILFLEMLKSSKKYKLFFIFFREQLFCEGRYRIFLGI